MTKRGNAKKKPKATKEPLHMGAKLQATKSANRWRQFTAHLRRLNFPEKPIICTIELRLKQQDDKSGLILVFGVNGWKEECCVSAWTSSDTELGKEQIQYASQVFPKELHSQAFELLTESVESRKGVKIMAYPLDAIIHRRKGDYDLILLPSLYRELLPVWQHAKRVYRKTRGFVTWRDVVKREIEMQLKSASIDAFENDPAAVLDDLIERLSQSPQMSEKQRVSLKDRRLCGSPGDLALDHAAHICGVPLYYYTLRHLQNHSRQE